MEDRIEALSARVAHLERAAGRWRTATLALAAAVAAGAILGADPAPAETRVARRFDVVDAGGHVRASLGLDGDDNVSLAFKDAQGRDRTHVALQSDGTTGVNLRDERLVDRVSLGLQADGHSSLVFRGADRGAVRTIDGWRVAGDVPAPKADGPAAPAERVAPRQPPMPSPPATDGNADAAAIAASQERNDEAARVAEARRRASDLENRRASKRNDIKQALDRLKDAQRWLDMARQSNAKDAAAQQQRRQQEVDHLRLDLDKLRVEYDAIQ